MTPTPMLGAVLATFTQRRSLAVGLAFCGIGLSSFAFNPLFQLMVENYTWRGALLILGGLSFSLIPCGALIHTQKNSEAPVQVDSDRGSSCSALLQRISTYLELSVLFERPFLTYCLAFIFSDASYFIPYVHLVAHSRLVGFSDYQSAFIMSASGITNVLGRVVLGWFADLGYMRIIHSAALSLFLTGVFTLLLPVSGSYPALIVVSLLYGFTSGALICIMYAVLPMIVGLERLNGAMGLLQFLLTGGPLVGVPLSGWLRDITGNYTVSFVVAGGFIILSSLTLSTLPHFFSCTDPPNPQRNSPDNNNKGTHSEMGPMKHPSIITDKSDHSEMPSQTSSCATASN
ncbi:hypothetical protein LDENG_00021370 [Lucifuga dentata]|nr:hypothetical protein LDENG_00021370 [Lucifuga dentata]